MNRVGIRIRKSVGNAVLRNRAKRCLREAHRRIDSSLKPGHDILMVVSRAHRLEVLDLEQDILKTLGTLGLLT